MTQRELYRKHYAGRYDYIKDLPLSERFWLWFMPTHIEHDVRNWCFVHYKWRGRDQVITYIERHH